MDFATFKSAVKAVVFPIGEPENLVTQHNAYIVDGLNHIQRYVKCYQENNVNVISFADTFYSCGLTVTNAPDGFIKRVYSIASDGCCKVNYRKSTRAYLQGCADTHAIDFGEKTRPDQTGKPTLSGTDLYPNSNADSTLGRATSGFWALEGCRLYLWPWLQSTEDLVIEWQGIKDSYVDADTIFDSSTQVQRAIRFYLQREIARDLDQDDQKVTRYTVDFQDSLGDLYSKCRQKMEGTYAEEDEMPIILNGCASPGTAGTFTPGNPDPNTPVTNPWLYRFAVVGNYGLPDTRPNTVASLINSWSPMFVATTGGNILEFDFAPASFAVADVRIGRNYHQFIAPYSGIYGAGSATVNRMWPCISRAEYFNSGTRATYKAYFSLPDAQEGRYYDRIEGPVHLFFLDTDPGVPDGNTASSTQAEWLRVKLATSPCKFKLVVMSRPPYSTYSDLVIPDLYSPASPDAGNTDIIVNIGERYTYTKNSLNDSVLSCGVNLLTHSGVFTASDSTCTLSGDPSSPLTATLVATGAAALRWPFHTWGATAVLTGGPCGYERLAADGLPILVNGAGGEDLDPVPAPQDDRSIVLNSTNHGAQLVTVNCDSLKFEFFADDGTLKDTFTINAPVVSA